MLGRPAARHAAPASKNALGGRGRAVYTRAELCVRQHWLFLLVPAALRQTGWCASRVARMATMKPISCCLSACAWLRVSSPPPAHDCATPYFARQMPLRTAQMRPGAPWARSWPTPRSHLSAGSTPTYLSAAVSCRAASSDRPAALERDAQDTWCAAQKRRLNSSESCDGHRPFYCRVERGIARVHARGRTCAWLPDHRCPSKFKCGGAPPSPKAVHAPSSWWWLPAPAAAALGAGRPWDGRRAGKGRANRTRLRGEKRRRTGSTATSRCDLWRRLAPLLLQLSA
jgi:hypothetical protein